MAGSFWELLLVLTIVLVFFGAGKLPTVMKDIGKGIRSLRDGLKEENSAEKTEVTKSQTEN
jgi:sec-independent protein translocase protein TatA